MKPLFRDDLLAILPQNHPLAAEKSVSLQQLAKEPFILTDEGEKFNIPLDTFHSHGLEPQLEYRVYDDYSVIAMVRQGLGVSTIYQKVLSGFEDGLAVRKIREKPERTVFLAWKNWETMPFAARKFADYIINRTEQVLQEP